MATPSRDPRFAQSDRDVERRQSDDLSTLNTGSKALSPRTAAEWQRVGSYTTDDLPSKNPALGQQKRLSDRILDGKVGIQNFRPESVIQLSAEIVEKVKKTFTVDESERILREDWIILQTEEHQLKELKVVIKNLEKAFEFSKSSALVSLATGTLKRCEGLVDRSTVHIEQCHLMFSQCSNEITTLQDYLGKLREAIKPPRAPREKMEEKRVSRRAEWAVSRMVQSTQSMVSELRENLEELDDLIAECTKLMVQTITLLHMRTHSADFSGTGVAVGAASVVAGALVGAAGIFAAPVTGGLSVPISIAGKGLFFTGVAALTPSTIMLNRHSQQLEGLVNLTEHLKARLEIMNQERAEMSKAFAACEDLELNVKQAGIFCQDALELDISAYESVWPFVEPIYGKLMSLNGSVTLFLESPSMWHFCQPENELAHYLLPENEED